MSFQPSGFRVVNLNGATNFWQIWEAIGNSVHILNWEFDILEKYMYLTFILLCHKEKMYQTIQEPYIKKD